MTDAVAVAVAVVGAGAACAALYLVVLAAASFFHRPPQATVGPTSRLAVLVPAYNEADLITRCVRSLDEQTYPKELYDVVVVADNCTDDTAAIAASLGARVLVRDEPDARGKGQALRWAMDLVLRTQPSPDALVVIDADSVADPQLLRALAARLEAGADAVQAEYLVLEDDRSLRSELRAAALLLFHRVRFAGRAVLGMPCNLVGNGMLFSRRLLEERPWSAFTSAEDLEYSVDLRLAGVGPMFAPEARVRAPIPSGGRAARTQRLRWEGGRFYVVRTRLPQLLGCIVRQQRWSLVDAAIDLAVPPLGLLTAGVIAGTGLAAMLVGLGAAPIWALMPWSAALLLVPLFVLFGLWSGHAPTSTYRALIFAPVFVVSGLLTRLRLIGGLRATKWERTERPSDVTADEAHRPEIGGVPIDPVDLDEALRRTLSAVEARTFMQVCTVNLDFLVNARRDCLVRSVLQASQLNLADGAPVVWLGRLLGYPLRRRVAGSDFVPCLMAAAERHGARVFFLGGEEGAAGLAAERLVTHHPNLVVAGVYEPPRTPLDQMDNDEILRRLTEAQPDILLVALGHPKQDRWIHTQRARLPVSVAIGVGCTFDLIAGYRRRAPAWMQMHGLEWAYRLAHEPRRLFVRYVMDACWLVAILLPICLRYRLLNRQP